MNTDRDKEMAWIKKYILSLEIEIEEWRKKLAVIEEDKCY